MSNNQESLINDTDIPSWIKASLFESVFKEIVPEMCQIKDFKAKRALSAGENYVTIMLRIEAVLELKDKTSKTLTLMLKTALDSEMLREMMKSHNIFDIEATMYQKVVPELEQLYNNVGLEVRFGAKSYQLSTDEPYILLEDLKPKNFINVNRLEGLDIKHTECVLKKLAQWHAASAVRVANKGLYDKSFSEGFLNKDSLQEMKNMGSSLIKIQMDCMKQYDGHELYFERMYEKKDCRLDELYEASQVDLNEFNVLNHGDCWSNNVMFKHDSMGNVVETYLVDYQLPRYGSPAQDLYYFLLSSTRYELKTKHFDYFISYYYIELSKHLKILNYSKKIPTLKDIHIMLHKYNPWALLSATGIMAVVLLDPNDDANLENFMGDNDAGIKFKIEMYSNARYRKHCEMIFPWLYNRGAI